ncbi:helix-turn-helix domain-containing protein (plasmid) [Bacillus thuringiensis LM1212]|nr:helix-turn-helix domain-containing protein [Bacillus thuringiensis LM1212]
MQAISKTRKFEVIFEMLEKGYTVTSLCTIAGITRSGYYKWLKRHLVPSEHSEKQLEDTKIKKKILECHKKLRTCLKSFQ